MQHNIYYLVGVKKNSVWTADMPNISISAILITKKESNLCYWMVLSKMMLEMLVAGSFFSSLQTNFLLFADLFNATTINELCISFALISWLDF